MNLTKLLTLTDTAVDVWSTLPKVAAFEFSNQRYIYATVQPTTTSIIRWFKVLDTDDGDPVLLLQNRNYDNDVLNGGITYDGEANIHQIFYISEITGMTFR
jgi:hypothetical protein